MTFVDDIGSYPLPGWMSQGEFNKIYPLAREQMISCPSGQGSDYQILKGTVLESFEKKLETGIDVITYPQHYDMHAMFLEPIGLYQKEPFLIEEKKAVLPEVEIIKEGAKELSQKTGKRINLGVCVTGPIELYLRTGFGANIYLDVLENLARSVSSYIKNASIETSYVKTAAFSLDEPSLGFSDLLNVDRDALIDVLETALKGVSAPVKMHMHTLKAADIALEVDGLTAIGGEFAAKP